MQKTQTLCHDRDSERANIFLDYLEEYRLASDRSPLSIRLYTSWNAAEAECFLHYYIDRNSIPEISEIIHTPEKEIKKILDRIDEFLMDHVHWFLLYEYLTASVCAEESVKSANEIPITELHLTARSQHYLTSAGWNTAGSVAANFYLWNCVRNLGTISLHEIYDKLTVFGIHLPPFEDVKRFPVAFTEKILRGQRGFYTEPGHRQHSISELQKFDRLIDAM